MAVRSIDADITDVTLQPTSIEGILNTNTTDVQKTETEDNARVILEQAARVAAFR